ncbi:MAG: hypothetical protein DRJ03_02670 [Chloroflexi bacterium]|nr:MAG: hypothetical protein DRJ03_02670 [Chloroflexota bacterium]
MVKASDMFAQPFTRKGKEVEDEKPDVEMEETITEPGVDYTDKIALIPPETMPDVLAAAFELMTPDEVDDVLAEFSDMGAAAPAGG